MKFDFIIQNPPYKKDLHLKIMNASLPYLKTSGTLVSLHPARWYQDPLASLKKYSQYDKYSNLIQHISDVQYISAKDACSLFSIGISVDLMITTIIDTPRKGPLPNKPSPRLLLPAEAPTLADYVEENVSEGIRVDIALIRAAGTDQRATFSSRQNTHRFVRGPVMIDGYIGDVWWTEAKKKNNKSRGLGQPPAASIRFNTIQEAEHFINTYNSTFIKNYIHGIRFGWSYPLKYIPYLDCTEPWTDSRLQKHFNLTDEEMSWMTREIYDYREKDYISYLSF